ncbi:HpcH/HpaI aldolase family protein [Haloplanus pelagicus]|jgi:2-dehydro-3-deoxyglucarate aldolase|uniref:HpcH/HpaI aldolase family protein n=1 Tax=Haloplanus pelagicus TaxID=2949995 RepID=UPI00203D6C79|nr:aldolase/citrate lyase family protein [Haloplanus sp. HW8-1]
MEQHNAFRERIENDEAVLGARASTFSPALIEIYGNLGLDFVWLDFEHTGESPWDSMVFEDLTRAAEAGDIELFVRLPAPDPALIRKVLDAGVRNLLIPRIDSAAEVRRAVEATRFVYDEEPGERGIAGGRSSAYGNADDYVRREDENVCLGVMIEKTTAVSELSEILSVPELGFVFIGPGDLSVQLGHPGNRDHPEVQETIDQIVAAGRDASVPVGGIAHDPELANEKIDAGYRIIRLGGEFESAQQVLGTRLDDLAELRDGE